MLLATPDADAASCSGSASSISARCFALLLQSFFSIDDFLRADQLRVHALATYKQLLNGPSNFDIILRTVTDGRAVVTILPRPLIAFPIAYYAARYAKGKWKVCLLSRRHAAAVVELPRQDLCLEADPRQGGHPNLGFRQAASPLAARCAGSSLPIVGGNPRCRSAIPAPSSSSSMSGCPS